MTARSVWVRTARHLILLAFLLALSPGCGADPSTDPAGPDASASGTPDASTTLAADANPADPDAAPPSRARVVNTGGTGLNLREGPGAEFAVITTIPEGAIVDLLGGVQQPWYEVRYLADEGWVHGDYLVPVDDPGTGMGGFNFLLPWQAEVGYRVTQQHNTGSHTGNGAWAWDFGMAEGTPLLAAHNGVVRRVKGDSTTGGCSSTYANDANYVVLDRGDGLETLYLHMKAVYVAAGQTIERGDTLGLSGQTGWACGAHLHFQIQRSPSGGGGETWYNPSTQEYFYDTGTAWDPPEGATPVSKNGVIDQP